jgi:hypothetical protein
MDQSHSIINLGDLSKPANTLIEKISDAVGGIFKPYQIRRVAQAEAEAEQIKAVSQIEISELQNRALNRFVFEEAKKQQNIESITQKALPEVQPESKPENMDDDWITNFFDKCRLISDLQMQDLWSKVLSGEANSPGRFSKRTIDLLSSLDKSDAELFTKLCSFSLNLSGTTPLVYDTNAEIYHKNGINFVTINHLESIGLITFESIVGYRKLDVSKAGIIFYFELPIYVEFPKPEHNEINIGKVILTKAGEQLAPICGASKIEGFADYLIQKWKDFGYKVNETRT